MKKRTQVGIILLLCALMLTCTGCKSNGNSTKVNQTATSKPTVTETNTPDIKVTQKAEVEAIDITALEELKGIPFTAEDKAHNLYRGMFGEEEVLLSLWIDKELQEAQVSFVGAYHSDKLRYDCEMLIDGVRFHNEDCYILLKQQEDDVLAGYYYETGQDIVDVNLSLEAINYTMDKEHMYAIGTDEQVENFAQDVLDSINAYDFEAFSHYVTFPITVHVNQAIQNIETKEDFTKLGPDVIFTDEFLASMAVAYPNMMFSNATDGVMLGEGTCNVWIQNVDGDQLKVVAINN